MSAILISAPKYVPIFPNPEQKLEVPSASPSSSWNDSTNRGKKRRLDHLTWEEKIQRKKLKNRVAAQTSRDRKKAKMDDMNNTISMMEDRLEILQNKCDSLESINESLILKNEKLDQQVEQLLQKLTQIENTNNNNYQSTQTATDVSHKLNDDLSSDCIGFNSTISNRSAVSIFNPLPKGMELKSIESDHFYHQNMKKQKNNTTAASLWKIITLCLLYKTCSKISMQQNLKISQKVCLPISQQTWKKAFEKAIQLLPKIQAKKSNCLDQWWGPQQSSWNPQALQQQQQTIVA